MRVAVALAVVAAFGVAHAQDVPPNTIVHRVRQGDTLELIAAELYGDRGKAVLIVVENKLPRPRPLRPGERLRIPISREVATAPGDTFESLAGAYLGSARRGPFLADFNGIAADDSLAAGTLITIPLTVVHTAASPESFTEISKVYFGDAKQAELLRRYNFLDKRAIDRNETVMVPAYNVRVAPSRQPPLDTESRARRDHRREATARIAKALPAARQAWKDGDYAEVKTALGGLTADLDYLDAGDAADAGVLLGKAQLAFDEADAAVATFKHVLDRQPRYLLRRYECAPKLIAAWQRVGGQVE
jgi:hypothetical protein